MGECLVGTHNCFGYGKDVHKVKVCPMIKDRGKESSKSQASGPSSDPSMNNCFYDLHSRGEQEDSPNDVTGMLRVFSINIYALVYPSAA